MEKPIIKIDLRPRDYAGHINLGNRIIASLTGNVNFTTPAVTLVNLQAAVTDVEDAYALWAPIGSRGSEPNLLDLRAKTRTLGQLLKAEAQYVMTTAQIAAGNDYEAMAALISTSGYELKTPKTPVGVLEMPQGLQRFVSRQLAPNQVKLKWSKPLNSRKGNVNDYHVMRSATSVLADAVQVGATTKTSFIDTNESVTTQKWTYWIIPFNTAGAGAPSDALTVSVLGA